MLLLTLVDNLKLALEIPKYKKVLNIEKTEISNSKYVII